VLRDTAAGTSECLAVGGMHYIVVFKNISRVPLAGIGR
jgi:hypothetical protein